MARPRPASPLQRLWLLPLLALVLQWAAWGMASQHGAERLAKARDGIVEICTPAGMIRLTALGEPLPPEPDQRIFCLFCTAAANTPPLPAPQTWAPLAAPELPLPPAPRLTALPLTPPLAHAPPRGPPLPA